MNFVHGQSRALLYGFKTYNKIYKRPNNKNIIRDSGVNILCQRLLT